MKLRKSIFPLMLILMFALSLTACGDTSSPSGTGTTAVPVAQTTVSDKAASTTVTQPETTKSETAYEVTYSAVRTYKKFTDAVFGQIIFEVTNTGTSDLYLSDGACDLEDSTGKLIASERMISLYPQVISPGEKAYYYKEAILVNLTETMDLTVKARPAVEKAKISKRDLAVSDVELQDAEYSHIKAIGRVENTQKDDIIMPYVVVVLFDTQGRPLAVIYEIIWRIVAAGSKIEFEAWSQYLPKDMTTSSVASFKAFAYDFRYQF